MITVRYKDTGRKRRLIVEGHGGGVAGADIFCAAASTLVITLESTLETYHIKHFRDIRDGFAEIKCNKPESRTVFYTCMCGFYTLAQMYPEHYKVEQ